MNLKLLNSLVDVIPQKGILIIMEATGIYYLLFSILEKDFNLGKSIIGFSLVFCGAIFEFLTLRMKITLYKKMISEDEEHISKIEKRMAERENKIVEAIERINSPKRSKTEIKG